VKSKFILILIIILAFGLRFWKLDSYPAFNADEAALGYNAYSLIQTGTDEHGNSWPIHFQSFNDFKPGGYVYLILPFVKVFGLNEWSVRFPNALLGVASVYVLYLLIIQMFNGQKLMVKKNNIIINHQSLAIIASSMLAISPWHIHFSRGGWEVNTATFFILSGVYLFLKFIETKSFKILSFSFLSFSISIYTYHSARLIVPLLGMGLLIIYWKELNIFNNLKKYLIYFFLLILFLSPLIYDLTKGSVGSRVAGVGLFADPGPISRIEEQRTEQGDFTGLPAKILHNKLVNYGLAFLENWGEHYHGLFLFLSGDDIQRNKVPETGQMYLYDLIFILVGFVIILKSLIINHKPLTLILYWLIVAPMAAALTFQSPHALRAQNMVIPLVIISAVGLLRIIKWLMIKSQLLRNIGFILIGVLIFWSFLRYSHTYWVHMSKEYPYSSQYGVKELVTYLDENNRTYKDIIITDRYDQPYILYLFYTKYDPAKFQMEHTLTAKDGYGFSTVRDFSNLHFYSVKFEEMRTEYPNSLIIGTPEEIPDEGNIIKRIYGSNGYEYFDVVAN